MLSLLFLLHLLLFFDEELALPRLSAVNCPDFAATVTAFYCPLTYAG